MSNQASRLLAATAVIALVFAPVAADARLGGGGSSGSRGGMTHSAPPPTRTAPNGASQMDRTTTQRAPTQAPAPGMAPMAPQRSGFMSGLMGGLIGAGIGGMLFGGGFMGHGMGFGGFFGFLIQVLLIVVIGRWLYRRFFSGPRAQSNGPGMFAREAVPAGGPPGAMGDQMMGGSAAYAPPPVQITPADFQTFEQMLQATQAAWTAGDLNALRGMATPEMVSYFADQMADLTSRGVTNSVTDVHLQSGDLSQAWAENGRRFATVAMRFSMIDVTKDGTGRVVDGSPTEHQIATELWTFVQSQGGHWILSAIQQAR